MDINSTSNIFTVYDTFDFSKIILTHPESLQGGSFFTKLNINNEMLYLQTPKCISKQGVVSSSGKKSYIDIMFSADDSKFIEFMENLEKSCVEKIHEKKNSWFTNDIDQNDIENAFTATLRPYKGGKYYLLRANIAPSKNLVKLPTCFVFDESENKLSLDDIKPENDLITVLEIQGIKFTSKSFQFEIILRQALIMANKPVFQSCVIKKNIQTISTSASASMPLSLERESEISNITTLSTSTVTLDSEEDTLSIDHRSDESNTKNEIPHHIQPHRENNLDKIQNSKKNSNSNIKFDLDNERSNDGENKNEDESESDSDDECNTDNQIEKKSISVSITESATNNLEKIETLELKELTEADLEIKNDENIILKKPNDIYYEIYSAAKEKARTARKLAFDAYLEVKKIKKTYMLDDSDSDFSNSSTSDNSENSDVE
jgi:hypothetical protein